MTQEIVKHLEEIQNSEVPEGYKQTKAGIIPKDWEVMRLKDKFDRLSRKNSEGNTNVLTISAQYGLINQEEFFKKEIASDDKSNYYLLHRGEFAYNKSYSNGYPFGAIKRLSRYDKGVVSPLYICFSANNNNACPEYYEQYFEAGRLNHEIQAYAQEGARNHGLLNISVIDFFNSKIIVPPIAEQKRIAKILSAQDKVIECYEKKIEQLKRMKKYYLQNMFPKHGESVPKIRFKGFTNPWEQRKLREMTSLITKGTTPLDKSNTGNVNFVRIESIDEASGEITITQKITSEEHEGYLRRSQLKENDILFSIAGTLGRVTSVRSSILPANTNQALAIIRLKTGDLQYVKTYLKGKAVSDYIKKNPTIGAQPNLSLEQVGEIEITLPTLDEQRRIGAYFHQLDDLITLHQRKLEEEKKKKKALQQLLLTGIVRTN